MRGVNDRVNIERRETGPVLTLSIFLFWILFLRRWAMRPRSVQKNKMIVTLIIGSAISQNRRSEWFWTDGMTLKFIPCTSIVGQIAGTGGEKEKETNEVTGEEGQRHEQDGGDSQRPHDLVHLV